MTFPCSGFTKTSQAKGTGKAQLQVTAEPLPSVGVTENLPLGRTPAYERLERLISPLQGSNPQWDLSQSRSWWLCGTALKTRVHSLEDTQGSALQSLEMLFLLPSERAVLGTASLSHRKTIFWDPELLFPLLGKKANQNWRSLSSWIFCFYGNGSNASKA